VVFVSATPGPYELEQSGGVVVEQVIRPTGLIDPQVLIRPAANQVIDLLERARERAASGERTLVTTLTKRLAEDLAGYLVEKNLRCRFLHSDIETLDRVEILRDLRSGEYDVLVGVNLLREGLDLPEVSLVAIMDADKAGFLRSTTSLIQQIGRAARNVNATVLLYADAVTPAMKQAIDETDRRRRKQLDYNAQHDITPQTIRKAIRYGIELDLRARKTARAAIGLEDDSAEPVFDRTERIAALTGEMLQAAEALEFEQAAALRDQIHRLKELDESNPGSTDDMPARPHKPKPGTPGLRIHKKNHGSKSRH
jgi:excinuclease ABC subunit B